MRLTALLAFAAVLGFAQANKAAAADAGAPFGDLPLIDEIRCGDAPPADGAFAEAPAGASQVQEILGQKARVLPNVGEAKYFAYRIGRGKGLRAGAAYVLAVDYPDDRPRTVFVLNRGAEMARGFRTGAALGDVLHTFTNNNVESLRIPQSGAYQTWKCLFFLHDRFPEISLPRGAGPRPGKPDDGFWVIVAQSKASNDPISAGAAVARIRLFHAPEPDKFALKTPALPEGVPARHIFWREEMADGVISSRKPAENGVDDPTVWYEHKVRLAKVLGVNTFCVDLLEFGHNQGWDTAPGGGNDWYVTPPFAGRWAKTLAMVAKHGMPVMPYYEYAGSTGDKLGIGKLKRCIPLSGEKAYTHIPWSEAMNADVTDPDTLADATKLLDATIVRFKDQNHFLGAWFRPRPTHMPMGFGDATLARFAAGANGGKAVTRADLQKDKALLAKYYGWWFEQRRAFIVGLRDHLRKSGVGDGATIVFTPDSSEPGRSLPLPGTRIVTDDPAAWADLLKRDPKEKATPIAYDEVVARGMQLEALTTPVPTWGKWEWHHSVPQADPRNYTGVEGAMLTYSFSNAYTVANPAAFDAFRTGSGLAAVRHYPLNEETMEKGLGYFACDVDRAGAYSMLSEVRAVANGDPRYLGILTSSSFNHGFPEHFRAFAGAFLALPALPSRRVDGASGDAEVVVRVIETKAHGAWVAIANTGLAAKPDVRVKLPVTGRPTDAVSGQAVEAADAGSVKLSMGPCELRVLRVR